MFLCCVNFFLISKLCSAMIQCSANALSSMLQGTAFYLIHRFAHTPKFQNDDVQNIAKVYTNMYNIIIIYISVNTCVSYFSISKFTLFSCFCILWSILNSWRKLYFKKCSSYNNEILFHYNISREISEIWLV